MLVKQVKLLVTETLKQQMKTSMNHQQLGNLDELGDFNFANVTMETCRPVINGNPNSMDLARCSVSRENQFCP